MQRGSLDPPGKNKFALLEVIVELGSNPQDLFAIKDQN